MPVLAPKKVDSRRTEGLSPKRIATPVQSDTQRNFHRFGDTTEKQSQRSRVVKFITENVASDLRMFSLPGESWVAEKQLAERYKFSSFVGCERDAIALNRSVRNMPGKSNARVNSYWIKEENRHVEFWKRFTVGTSADGNPITTCNATLINIDAWRYWEGMTASHWNPKSSLFYNFYQRVNAIWIDSFSPLGCEGYGRILRGVAKRSKKSYIACAFSFLLGRDDSAACAAFRLCPGNDPLSRRASFIALAFANAGSVFEVRDTFLHSSFNDGGNVKIATVMGIAGKY